LSLPVLALVRLLGAVELEQMFAVIALCATTAMFGAAVGLLLSIMIRRAYAVIILSYMLMAFAYFFAPMIIMSLWRDQMGRVPWMKMMGTYNPFFAAGMLGWGEWRRFPIDWVSVVMIHVIATAVVLVVASLLVRQLARREGEGATPAPEPMGAPSASDNGNAIETAKPVSSRARKARDNRTVSDAPVLWRELRRPLLAKPWQRRIAVLATCGMLALAYAAAYSNNELHRPDFHAFLACCFYTLLLLIVCVLSATSITQEKEGESWMVLVASPISGQAIVWAKTLGVLRRMLWPMLLVVLHFLIFTMFSVISPAEMVLVLFVTASFNVIWVATGVAISLHFRKVTAAVITNLALPVALYGAGSLILAVVDSLIDVNHSLFNQVTWYMPYFYFAEGVIGNHSYRTTREFPGIRENVSMTTFLTVAIIVGCLHILAAAGLLAWTAARFNAIVGRAPQRERLPQQASANIAI
jgi:ABC-type transport system involved in multi-copper enzyme maturation permease subunit